MNEWPECEFITESEPDAPSQSGWETVRFQLDDEQTTDEEIAKDFFVSFVALW